MADRYRDQPYQDEDYGRDPYAAPKRPAESDPLAELARLIGQTDPFSTFGRDAQHVPPPNDDYIDEAAAAYGEPLDQPSWVRNVRPSQEASYGDEDRYNDDSRGYDQSPQFDSRSGHGADDRYDDVLFGQPERDSHRDAPFPARDRYRDDRYEQPHYDDDLDDEPPRRRGGMMSVVVVMLLAVVGTAAAFGYRTFIGSPRSGEPPVIKADTGPNKVMSSSGDSKQINDRVGDKPAERVVSREEQPLDVNGKAQPRVVFPPLTQNANPPNAASANTATRPTGAGVGNGTVTTGGEEPRKIRTLTIRPDQPSDQTASADTSSTPPPAPRAAPAPSVAPRVTQTAPASTGNGPIALTPQSAAPATDTRPKVASIASSSAGAAGSYVQVSSQKTEADAQTSFKAIQAKYSEVLGSKSATIRRADLGDKGVFYRALVGPFGTTDEATQFCVSLKAAGGQCIVQRN